MAYPSKSSSCMMLILYLPTVRITYPYFVTFEPNTWHIRRTNGQHLAPSCKDQNVGRLVFRRLKHGTAYANKLSKPFMRIIRPYHLKPSFKRFMTRSQLRFTNFFPTRLRMCPRQTSPLFMEPQLINGTSKSSCGTLHRQDKKPCPKLCRPGILAADIKYFNVHSRKLSARPEKRTLPGSVPRGLHCCTHP